MSGTSEGARKVRDQLLARNKNHYREIGARGKKGGHNSSGSFQPGSSRAAKAGEKGGARSIRNPAIKNKVNANQLKEVQAEGQLVDHE